METAKQLHEVVNVVTGMDTLNRTPLKDWNWPNRTLKNKIMLSNIYSPSRPFSLVMHRSSPRKSVAWWDKNGCEGDYQILGSNPKPKTRFSSTDWSHLREIVPMFKLWLSEISVFDARCLFEIIRKWSI